MAPLVLASKSPRRSELLHILGLDFEVLTADADESVLPNETPSELVQRLAKNKALAVVEAHQLSAKRWVLAGDTVVALQDQIFGKPANRADAKQMLQQLSGQTHQVLTSIAVWHGTQLEVRCNQTLVTFRELTDQELERYLDQDEAYDKAGAYAIQGQAAKWVCNMNGSYHAVMGLPVFELEQLLQQMNFYQ